MCTWFTSITTIFVVFNVTSSIHIAMYVHLQVLWSKNILLLKVSWMMKYIKILHENNVTGPAKLGISAQISHI